MISLLTPVDENHNNPRTESLSLATAYEYGSETNSDGTTTSKSSLPDTLGNLLSNDCIITRTSNN